MAHRTEHPTVCAKCTAWIPGSKWDTIRAAEIGWFFQKDGTAYCPEHVPAWVPGWRVRRAR